MIAILRKVFFIASFVTLSSTAFAQQYYVVIGVFAQESNASKFAGYARSKYLNAEYLFNSKQNLFFVVSMRTTDKKQASQQAIRLRNETEFTDSWAYYGLLGNDTAAEPVAEETPVINEAPPVVAEAPPAEDTPPATEPEPPVEQPGTDTPDAPAEDVVLANPRGKYFKFLINDPDSHPLQGEVHYVDFDRGRDLATYQANRYIDVLRPGDSQKPMTMVCGIFGYREVIKPIDYNNPATTEGAYQDDQGAWVIPYQLQRLAKGDVSVMYRVSFYKDAVVMTQNSRAEMDELVNMMQRNPGYAIKIHGHCNGNNDRRIIALGEPKNYFDVKGSDERPGSAKHLTTLRAKAVQSYLADHGIDLSRTKIFSWGGTNMLVSETSTSARLNDRIEIEVLED